LHGGCLSISNRRVNIRDSIFTGCYAKSSGGAITVSGSSHLEIYDTQFINNKATTEGEDCDKIEESSGVIGGGAISGSSPTQECPGGFANIKNTILKIGEKSLFQSCSSYCGKGGSLYLKNVQSTIGGLSTFKDSTARSGGAIFASKSSTTIVDSKFDNNHATSANGGALEILGTSTEVTGCTFQNNKAAASGGSMFFIFSDLKFDSNNINNNEATSGGGIFMGFGCSLISSDNLYSNNMAILNGGAIYLKETKELESNSDQFINNHGFNGGCIYIFNPLENKFSLKATTFKDCAASVSGGAVYFEVNGLASADYKLTASSIEATNNNAMNGAGGIFYWKKDDQIMNFNMLPGVKVSFKVNEGNYAKVGNILASGPCKLIQWTGPLHGNAEVVDRTHIGQVGVKIDREQSRLDDLSLFQKEVVAGADFIDEKTLEVALLDYYGQHLKIHEETTINELMINDDPNTWIQAT
jgi:hypothetical protein